jgi:glyoxylase-like metal-dependent hydrolase (beta-lactamase superfamily II)
MATPPQPQERRKPELGRGERILPGVFRLRLPLPWPGVPHGNAWAVTAGDGYVLFDTGVHDESSTANLELALQMCGLRIEDARLLVCTHAHADHYGAAASIVDRARCELWMHPNHGHTTKILTDRQAELDKRLAIARDAGVPPPELERHAKDLAALKLAIERYVEPDRDLIDGVTVQTDIGVWRAYETPGHSPSHVCLFEPQRRLLISGDHLLGRISQHFDYGHSPDPIGEFLQSLQVVEALRARLCMPGHGRTFTDVKAHIDGNRTTLEERLAAVLATIAQTPRTAYEVMRQLVGLSMSDFGGAFALYEILATLTHLQRTGRAHRIEAAAATAAGQPPASDAARWLAN